MSSIRLVAGLGNPGPRYEHTRHNVGARFVLQLARSQGIELKLENRFKGLLGRGQIGSQDVRLVIPTTFMNLSGECVGAVMRFFRMEPEELLVAYDEMAFEPGVLRLKAGGGANGHNGIESVIASLGNSRDFHRLRIGVGHPGDKSRVTAYLTSTRMPGPEVALVDEALAIRQATLECLVAGDMMTAMNQLHAPAPDMTNPDAPANSGD